MMFVCSFVCYTTAKFLFYAYSQHVENATAGFCAATERPSAVP